MVKRRFIVHPIFRYVWKANRLLPGGKNYETKLGPPNNTTRDEEEILYRTTSEIEFNTEEVMRGEAFLQNLGITEGQEYVCLIVRDSAYKETLRVKKDWSYHSYRDSDVNDYIDAAMWLVDNGYWVLRMGKGVQSQFLVEHPRVIDYATSKDRSDFLDIWLMANCRYCISTGTGLDEVVGMSDKPTVFVNLLPLNHIPLHKCSITVPKILIWKDSNKMLSLQEYIEHGYLSTENYKQRGIEIESLSPSEIKEVVIEMENHISGKHIEDKLGTRRQDTAIEIILRHDKFHHTRNQYYYDTCATLGSDFLERYWSQLYQ